MLSYSLMLLMCLSLVLRVLAMILSSPQTTKEGVWPWPPESLSHNADLYSICASLSLVLQNLTSMLMYDSLTTPQALPCSQSSNQYLLTIQLSQPSLTLRLTCRETNPPGSSKIKFHVYQHVQTEITSRYSAPSQLFGMVISEFKTISGQSPFHGFMGEC
jgi:hypothetical protein